MADLSKPSNTAGLYNATLDSSMHISSVFKKTFKYMAKIGRFILSIFVLVYLVARYALKMSRPFFKKVGRVCFDVASSISRIFTHKSLGRVNSFLFVAFLAVLVLSFTSFGFGTEVIINGESIGFVTNKDQFKACISEVEHDISAALERPYRLENIEYRFGFAQKNEISDPNEFKEKLTANVTQASTLFVLKHEDQVIAAAGTRAELDQAMDQLLQPHRTGAENENVAFVEPFEIEQKLVDSTALKTTGEVVAALTTTTVGETNTYTIQDGDTAEGVAQKNGMTLPALKDLNPSVSWSKLKQGQKVYLSKEAPLASVKVTRRVDYIEAIPYETTTEKSDSLYTNEKKVKVKGVRGQTAITADLVLVDNKEISRDIISNAVISEPVTEVLLVGTKPVPAKAATGKFMRPAGGYVSSPYGYRGREFHTGIDYANPSGSPIYAADGGTVTFSGWKGNYGKMIIINHGNGYETVYAHCSALSVTVGQKVAKGQRIASVGSTGRSTGPHLHFEIRKNGKHQNPALYV